MRHPGAPPSGLMSVLPIRIAGTYPDLEATKPTEQPPLSD